MTKRRSTTEPKTFLGQTGPWGPSDIVRIILERPEAAAFLAHKLYRYFVSEAGTPGRRADRAPGRLRSSSMISPSARSSRPSSVRGIFIPNPSIRQRIKSPVEFSAGLVRMLEMPRTGDQPAGTLGRLRHAGPGTVRSAECRGLGRRPDLDQ